MEKRKIIKTFIFSILLLFTSALFWLNLSNLYLKGDLSKRSLILTTVSFLFFLVFLLIFSLLVENKGIFLLISLLSLSNFFLFFKFHYYLLIGLFIVFLSFVFARFLIQKERNERLKISLRSIFRNSLKLILFFLAGFFALLSYFYPLIKINNFNLSPKTFDFAKKFLIKNENLNFFDLEENIDEILAMKLAFERINWAKFSPEIFKKIQGKKISEISFEEILKDPEISQILKEEAKKIEPSLIAKERDKLAKSLNVEIKENEKVFEIVNKLINKRLNDLLGPYLKYLPIISAISLFLFLEIIFVPFSWLVMIFIILIFQILLIFRIVKIEKVMKEGEDFKF